MQSPVFISYSSKDVVLANKIVDYLEGQGYPCWIAPRNIASGHDYTDSINDAILHCRAVVLIISHRSIQSQWVKKELSTAVSYNKPIFPYLISNIEITGGLQFLLNNVQWIDASSSPTGHFPDIVDGIEQRLSPATPPVGKGHGKIWLVVTVALVVAGAIGGLLAWNHRPASVMPEADTLVETSLSDDTTAVAAPHAEPIRTVAPKKEKVKEKPSVQTVTTIEKPIQEEVAEPVATVAAPDTVAQNTARQAAAKEQAFQKKLRMAKNLYIDHSYREALALFEELHREKPQNAEINAYISDCRKVIGR